MKNTQSIRKAIALSGIVGLLVLVISACGGVTGNVNNGTQVPQIETFIATGLSGAQNQLLTQVPTLENKAATSAANLETQAATDAIGIGTQISTISSGAATQFATLIATPASK